MSQDTSGDNEVRLLLAEDESHAIFDCVLTPHMAGNIKECFDMELDLLRAEQVKLEDGRTRYQFTLYDRRKIAYMITLVNRANLMMDAIQRSN